MKIYVGCTSNENIPSKYLEDSKYLLEELFKDNDLVFEKDICGLRGLAYKIAKENDNEIIDICSNLEYDTNISNSVLKKIENIVKNSDAIVFLPGGIDTINELFMIINYIRNNQIDKPVIIYNSLGFFTKLILYLDKLYIEGFNNKDQDNYHVSNSYIDVLNYIEEYKNSKSIRK